MHLKNRPNINYVHNVWQVIVGLYRETLSTGITAVNPFFLFPGGRYQMAADGDSGGGGDNEPRPRSRQQWRRQAQWRCRWWLWRLAVAAAVCAGAASTAHGWTPRNGSRIQINNRPMDGRTGGVGHGRGQSAIRLGVLKNRLKEPVELSATTTAVATTTSTERFRRQPAATVPRVMSRRRHQNLTVGLVLPYKSFDTRIYTKEFTSAMYGLQRNFKTKKDNIFKSYDIHHIIDMKQLTPTPTGQSMIIYPPISPILR